MKTTLLIPTLNEVIGMKAIMPTIKREWVDQILILDGQSTDGTAEYAREQGYEVYGTYRRSSSPNLWRLDALGITAQIKPVSLDLLEFIPSF